MAKVRKTDDYSGRNLDHVSAYFPNLDVPRGSSSTKAGKMRAADGSAAAAHTKRVKKMGSLLPMLLRKSAEKWGRPAAAAAAAAKIRSYRSSNSSARQGKRDKYT
jgi:hypothetical protein